MMRSSQRPVTLMPKERPWLNDRRTWMALTKKQQLAALLQSAIDSYRAGRLDQAIDRLGRDAKDFPNAVIA